MWTLGGARAIRASGWTSLFRLKAFVMVGPVVYLVAAALLVGLIFFLTRSRGRATAGKRYRRSRTGGDPFSGLSLCRPSHRGFCACAGLACLDRRVAPRRLALVALQASCAHAHSCASGSGRRRSALTLLAEWMAALYDSFLASETASLNSSPRLPTLQTQRGQALADTLPSLIGAPNGEAAGGSRPTQAGSRMDVKKGALECFVLTYEL